MLRMLASNRQRFGLLTLLMAVTSLLTLITTVYVLYTEAVNSRRDWLIDVVHNQVGMIEAILDSEKSNAERLHDRDWMASTLTRITQAQTRFKGFGRTGEFVIARQEGNVIRFLIQQRNTADSPAPAKFQIVPANGPTAIPMQRAVEGGSGWIIGPDYRGIQVLAAYAPIPETDWGMVAKLDMTEVRWPFVRAGAVTGFAALVLILLSTLLFMRISSPIVRHLEESAGRMQGILDSAGDGIVGVDVEGRFTFVNAAAARMWGWPAEELIGKPAHAAVHHSKPDGTPYPVEECEVCSTIKDGVPRQELEGAYWRRNGTWFPVARTVNALRCDGRIVGLVVVFRDITERKKSELNLQLAQYELTKRNTEMEQFIYTVSHDLKSPLVTMQGFASHLRTDIAKQRFDRIEDFVQRINNAADRMKRLIDELLELSRIGRFVAPPQDIAVSDLIKEIADRYEEQITAKGITLIIAPDMPMINADRNRINQAFENLLINAVRYAGESPQPRIEVGAVEEAGEIRFFVRDNGPGIAEEYHERIFRLFQRLDSHSEGTGVGLAIVKRVVEFHGGRVWVESVPGQGATFWLSIPQNRRQQSHPVDVDRRKPEEQEVKHT